MIFICFLYQSHHLQHIQPPRHGKGAGQGGNEDGIGGEGSVMVHIFGHDVAADGGGRAQHHEDGEELTSAEFQQNSQRQEDGCEKHQLVKTGQDGGLETCDSFFSIEGSSHGHKT